MKALEHFQHLELLRILDFRGPAFVERCVEIARTLFNSTVLVANGNRYRIREVEFYGFAPEYPDLYVQQHPQQLKFGYWHFHRMGNKLDAPFRFGTRKGLDLTLGDGERYVGVLLRSIEGAGGRIDGSSLLVDELLKSLGVASIQDIPKGAQLELLYQEGLEKVEHIRAPRVGLFARKKIDWKDYVDHMYAPLRFIAEPKATSKGRDLLFLYQTHLIGAQAAQTLLGLSDRVASKWMEFAQSGKPQDMSQLLEEKLTRREASCRAYGAYLAHCKSKNSKK